MSKLIYTLKKFARAKLFVVAISLSFSSLASTQEAFTRKEVKLLTAPEISARMIAQLSTDEPVNIVTRKGFWIEVNAGQHTGWLKLSALRFQKNTNYRGSLARLESGRKGAGNNVASTGVRGLEANVLALATPDYDAFSKFEKINLDVELRIELQNIKTPKSVADFEPKASPKKKAVSSKYATKTRVLTPNISMDIEDEF